MLPLIVFKELEQVGVKTIMFSDDGLLYGRGLPDEPLRWVSDYLGLEHLGIEFSKEKSGWVKRHNKWIKPLKFVGLLYNPFKDCLQASTRNGSVLPLEVNVLMGVRDMDKNIDEDFGGIQLSGELAIVKDFEYDKLLDGINKK